jgi:hypothetical protein
LKALPPTAEAMAEVEKGIAYDSPHRSSAHPMKPSTAALLAATLFGMSLSACSAILGYDDVSGGGSSAGARGGSAPAGGGGATSTGGSGAAALGGAGGSCSNGLTDCGSGCVTHIDSDAHNCGSCQHDCLGGECANSQCQPILLADPHSLVATGGTLGNGFLCLDATMVYFTFTSMSGDAGGVGRVRKDGSLLSCIDCAAGVPREIANDGTTLAWVDIGLNAVRSGTLGEGGAGPVSTVVTGYVGSPFQAFGHYGYWLDTMSGALKITQLQTGATNDFALGQSGLTSIVSWGLLDVYWTTESAVMMAGDTPSSPVARVPQRINPGSLVHDVDHLYWTEGAGTGDSDIWRLDPNGGTPSLVTSGQAWAIAVDDTHVYVADDVGRTIWRALKSGGAPELLVSEQAYPFDIAVDETAVYWTSESTAQVFKLAK